jgi:hypothetical protein
VVKQAERGSMDFKRFANGLSKFANYASAARGSAACCAESLWLSGQGGILPPPPRHGKAKPFRTAGRQSRWSAPTSLLMNSETTAGLPPRITRPAVRD